MTGPIAQPEVYGGTSTSERDAILEASASRSSMSVPDVGDPRPVILCSGSANGSFFGGNTRIAPFTGTSETVTRGSTTYAGSGGPCGLRVGNSSESDLGPPYQGFVTAYNISGGHSGGRQFRVSLRGTNAQTNAQRQSITLAEDVEYRVILWPHSQNIAGPCLPAPENLAGCKIFRVHGTDSAHAAITYVGGRDVAGTTNDVQDESPFIPLTLISEPTLAGYSTLTSAPAAGDLVFIVSYELQDLDGDGTPETEVYAALELGGDTHELIYTGSRGAVGDRGIWYPYQSFQRAGGLNNPNQLVSFDAPFPAGADKTEDNWYLKPTITLPPDTLINGQTLTFRTTGNLAWGASGSVYALEILMLFSDAEEGGWDPWLHESAGFNANVNHWFDKGPYATFTGGSWNHGALTLTVAGSGIGDAGHACVWITGGTNATVSAYAVTGGSGDAIILGRTIGASASTGITGFAGGHATDVAGETWVSGKLNNDNPTGSNNSILIIQSDAITDAGNVNFSAEVKLTHISNPAVDTNLGLYTYNVEAEIVIGGVSNGSTGVIGSTAPAATKRTLALNIPNGIVNPRTQHLGVTVLMRGVEATTATGEFNIPGVHGWFPRSPYNPKNGMGWPIRFATTGSTPVIVTCNPENGSRLLRPRSFEFVYQGSQNK